jgi:hypothetical protein
MYTHYANAPSTDLLDGAAARSENIVPGIAHNIALNRSWQKKRDTLTAR